MKKAFSFLKRLNFENNSLEKFKLLNRAVFLLLILMVLFYLVKGAVSYRFDTRGAQNYIGLLTQNYAAKSGFAPGDTSGISWAGLKNLDTAINNPLIRAKYAPMSISNIMVGSDSDSAKIVFPDIPSNSFAGITGVSSVSYKGLAEIVSQSIGNGYYLLNFDQFVQRGAFASDAQVGIIWAITCMFMLFLIINSIHYYGHILDQKKIQAEQDKLRKDVLEGSQASPVWELAQITLNKYYQRNLLQNNWIFYVSVVVMIAGFGLIMYGVGNAYGPKSDKTAEFIAAGSGVIVQFIGATFLVVYNSTITQAAQYTTSLQKLSTIGTSIKILDSIILDNAKKMEGDIEFIKTITNAKIDLAKSLIEQSKS